MTAYNPGDRYRIKSNTNLIFSDGKPIEFDVVKGKVGIFQKLDDDLQAVIDFDGMLVLADLYDIERVI